MNRMIENTGPAIRAYAVSASGFIAGISAEDISAWLQIFSFVISILAGIITIYIGHKRMAELKRREQNELQTFKTQEDEQEQPEGED